MKGWIYSYSETSNVNSDTCTMDILLPPNKYNTIIGNTRALGNGHSIIYDEFYIDASASTTIHNIYTDAVGRKLEKITVNRFDNAEHILNCTFKYTGAIWSQLVVGTCSNSLP